MPYLSKRLLGNGPGARYITTEETVAEVLAPGFFPASAALNLHDELTVIGLDGGVKVYVKGFDLLKRPLFGVFGEAPLPGLLDDSDGEEGERNAKRLAALEKARAVRAANRAAAVAA
jgi:hypothetical protein